MAKHISELSRGEIAYLVRAVCELAWARMQHLLRQTQHIIDDLRSGIQLSCACTLASRLFIASNGR